MKQNLLFSSLKTMHQVGPCEKPSTMREFTEYQNFGSRFGNHQDISKQNQVKFLTFAKLKIDPILGEC